MSSSGEYIFELRQAIKDKNSALIKEIIEKNNLILKDGKIFSPKEQKEDCKSKSKFYDQRQMINKILLNSLAL